MNQKSLSYSALFYGVGLFVMIFALFSCGNSTKEKKQRAAKNPEDSIRAIQDNPYFYIRPEIRGYLEYFDSVYSGALYYFDEGNQRYFIVYNGNFETGKNGRFASAESKYTLGIIGEKRDTVLSFEYSKIGNPDVFGDGWVEVKKNGKYGLFHLGERNLIEPVFDAIYPAEDDSYWLKVKKNGKYYLLIHKARRAADLIAEPNLHFSDTALFKSPYVSGAIRNWKFDFERSPVHFIHDMHAEYDEASDNMMMSSETFIAPSYLVESGILPEESGPFYIDKDATFGIDVFQSGNTHTSESKNWVAYLVEFATRWSESRGEIEKTHTLEVHDLSGKKIENEVVFEGNEEYKKCIGIRYQFLDTSLLEARFSGRSDFNKYDEMPVYRYYKIHPKGNIESLGGRRQFKFTRFVRLDSNYLSGCFFTKIPDPKAEYPGFGYVSDRFDSEDLTRMLMEIYADNDMRVPIAAWQDTFKQYTWYKPFYEAEDFRLNSIDQYNVLFLKRILESIRNNEEEWVNKRKEHAPFSP